MAKGAYIGVSGKARKIKKIYIGVNGKARKVKKAYIGVNGKARLFYNAADSSKLAYSHTLSNSNPLWNSNGTTVGDYCIFAGGISAHASNGVGLNKYSAYNSSLSQTITTFSGSHSTYGMVHAIGVNNGTYACFPDITTYSYTEIFNTSVGIIRRINSSLTSSDVAQTHYLTRTAIVVHKGSILTYGGLSYANGSNDYGTYHADYVYRYNESFTESSIQVTTSHMGYCYAERGATIGNYAMFTCGMSPPNMVITLNQSFTLGSNITFTYGLTRGGSISTYAVFGCRNNSQTEPYLACVNSSLTATYKNSGYHDYLYSDNAPLPYAVYDDSIVDPNFSATNTVTKNTWLVCNKSLTTRAFAHGNSTSGLLCGVAGSYMLRLCNSNSSAYNSVEVLAS